MFDVNETLLDLSSLDPWFVETFGDAAPRKDWFNRVLQSALTAAAIGSYHDFGSIGRAAVQDLAALHGITIMDMQMKVLADAICRLRPHDDVVPGLTLLRESGCRLIALSNGNERTLPRQMEYAKLTRFFEYVISVDAVRQLKPGPAPYVQALALSGQSPAKTWFFAAHGWDIAGAGRVGMRTAFIERAGKTHMRLLPPPTIVAPNISEAARQVLALSNPSSI